MTESNVYQSTDAVSPEPTAELSSLGGAVWKRYRRHRMAVLGLFVVAFFAFCAALAPLIAPYSPYAIGDAFDSGPSAQHVLGVDKSGRDVLSRLIFASRVYLVVGVGTVVISVAIGLALGLASGYFGGKVDMAIMRVADIFMSFPPIMLILVVVSIVGPSMVNLIVIMGLLGWPSTARLVRSSALSIKESDYVKACLSEGMGTIRILIVHVLPNALGPILVNATFGVAGAILMEAGLSFLGLGVQPPTASWGNMLSDAQSITVLTSEPWLWVPPGVMIILNVLAFNFIGDGLRDALDPRARG